MSKSATATREKGLNKAQLIEWMQKSGEVGETKAAAERALACVIKGIEAGLKKQKKVNLVGFGSFSVRQRKPRTVVPPGQSEPMKVKGTKTVTFKAGKALKEKVK